MPNEKMRSKLIEVIDNQLSMDEPKCAKVNLDRLINSGYTEQVAKEKIATVLVEEMYDVMKQQTPFNETRYCKKLGELQ
ncbi:hypothetical protein GWK91_10515 [Virgibacillus sp. MSP4-1]|uniref:hypothetical protein n=1 Tax=Virgibacillus sp. MSP4-1 TaxID=2700081 RepID=UPI00039CE51C|nr:hypothetical protein [Virgibacillus sp. MSP4-1]QHS23358.1 hypothetical protein GWK91_10515 [Virgibacillus sp. MSP4-1]